MSEGHVVPENLDLSPVLNYLGQSVMRIARLDFIVQFHIVQLGAANDLFLFSRRQGVPTGKIMEILLNDHITSSGEPRVLAGDESCIDRILTLRVLRSIYETDEVAAVKITKP